MNVQLHRKQIIILVLAMVLAIASQWIPLPSDPQNLNSKVPEARPAPANSETLVAAH